MIDEGEDYGEDETCPDGFCRHWSCYYDCTRVCAACGVRCAEHDDGERIGAISHEWVEVPE